MIEYLLLATSPPPLNVKLLVRKSKCALDDGAKVVVLNSTDNKDIQCHLDYLAGDKYDQWAFVNPGDAYEYEQKLTERWR